MNRRPARRTIAAAVVAAALVALAVFFLVRAPSARRHDAPIVTAAVNTRAPLAQARPAETATTTTRLTPSPKAAAASPVASAIGATPTAAPAAEDAPTGPQTVVALARQAADDYRQQAQYPPWSRPIPEDGEDPILRDREVSPITAGGPNGEDPTLTVFPDQVSFEAPDPVVLYAYLSAGGRRVPAASITGTVMTEQLQPLIALIYRDDGGGGDPLAGDDLYTARFEPGPDFAPDLSESFLVRVVARTTDEQERIAAGGFLYSNPHARLTGNYRDTITDGSLAIDAEVEVFRPGRFHLEGTLYTQDGRRGIAEAQQAAELPPGRHWLRLLFFGRILAQSQIDGPYLLRFAALSTTTGMPNAKNRLVENAHRTGPYRFAQFNSAPFDDPDLLDAAERLEGDLAGGAPTEIESP